MDLLRFITAGSVDDGKSTLIGRLLYDSKSILADHLEAIQQQSKNKLAGEIDLALLTDGLRAEREQGITIDVAYKYFNTPKRKFIIADAPGHIQYTRNMVTGASTASLVVILVDARQGVVEQTRRHSIIASLLRIPHVVVAINKMDLVEFAEKRFDDICNDYREVAAKLNLPDVHFIPISALLGDNIVDASANMPWYNGTPLLQYLEEVEIDKDVSSHQSRFCVQYVMRPQTEALHDYRGYAGQVVIGKYFTGQRVTVYPQGIETTISLLEKHGKPVEEVEEGEPVVIHLKDDVDISRGDVIIPTDEAVKVSTEHEVFLCWMGTEPLKTANKYLLQLNSSRVRAVIKNVSCKIDVNTLQESEYDGTVKLNEVVRATIKTARPLVSDSYHQLRANGGAILIDETSNLTVGACMLQ